MADDILDTTWGFRQMPGLAMQRRQLEEQKRWRQDQISQRQAEMAQRQAEMAQRAAEQFGAYAVTGPDGGIDIQASARAMQAGQQAAQLGEAEALSGQSFADVDQAIRQMPEYRMGFAKGAASEAAQQRNIQRFLDVQELRNKGAEERAQTENIYRGWEAMGEALNRKLAKGDFVTVTRETPDGGRYTEQVPKADFERKRAQDEFLKENKPTIRAARSLREVLQVLQAMPADVDVKVVTDADGNSTIKEGGLLVRGSKPASQWREIVGNKVADLESQLQRKAPRQPSDREDGAPPRMPAAMRPAATPTEPPPMDTNAPPTLMDLLSSQPSSVMPMARTNAPMPANASMPANAPARTNAPARGVRPRYVYDVRTGQPIPVEPMPQR